MSTDKINLEIPILKDAKICSRACEYKHDDGQLEILGNNSLVTCVGCGKKCHMQCQKIPNNLVESVNSVPQNNRIFAYFGQMSYMRVVCDNCANLLNSNVDKGKQPTFQSLFEKIATEVFEKKLKERENEMKMNMNVEPIQSTSFQINSLKRKKSNMDGDTEEDSHDPTNNILISLLAKIEEMNGFMKLQQDQSKIQYNDVTKLISDVGESVNLNIDAKNEILNTKIDSVKQIIGECALKLERNESSIDDGLQKGFNNLFENVQKCITPLLTPVRVNPRSSLRRAAFTNNTTENHSDTPRSRWSQNNVGPNLPTESGRNENVEIFGPAISRRINFGKESQENAKAVRPQFRHNNAIYVRYVDSSITADKMLNIVKINQVLNEAIQHDPGVIEINRLVKKSLTEEEIARFKNGVSFRIGCADFLFEALQSKENWANHWEIRLWDPNFKTNEKRNSDEMETESSTSAHLNDLQRSPQQVQRKD